MSKFLSRESLPRILAGIGVLFLLLFPIIYSRSDYDYVMHLWVTAFFYAILAASWSLLAGYAGQFSFGHMAFMAIGAYGTGLFSNYLYLSEIPTQLCSEWKFGNSWLILSDPIGVTSTRKNCVETALEAGLSAEAISSLPVWLSILVGIILGGIFGFLVGALVLRLRATYLALFTIGFSEILRATISAELNITRGQAGLEMQPLFSNGVNLFGLAFDANDKVPPYYAMLFLFLICMGFMTWLVSSRFGLFIQALREDEEAAAALGVNIVRFKILVFVITSMMAAAAGAVQAHYIGIITPNILMILQMSLVIAMAVIGGLESIVSAAIGAIIIQFALELLRTNIDIGPYTIDMSIWRLVFFGLLLMLTLRFRRNGLIHPIINWFSRSNVAQETIAKRVADSSNVEDPAPKSEDAS